jgi:hypothetical protein
MIRGEHFPNGGQRKPILIQNFLYLSGHYGGELEFLQAFKSEIRKIAAPRLDQGKLFAQDHSLTDKNTRAGRELGPTLWMCPKISKSRGSRFLDCTDEIIARLNSPPISVCTTEDRLNL